MTGLTAAAAANSCQIDISNIQNIHIIDIDSTSSSPVTHTQQLFYGPLSGTTRVSRYQKKHSPTHHPDHHPNYTDSFIKCSDEPHNTNKHNFAACVQSVHHQHAYMISDCRTTGHRSLDNVLFKVNPSLHQAFLQVIDITNLCSVHALLHNTPNFIIYRSILMKHTRYL